MPTLEPLYFISFSRLNFHCKLIKFYASASALFTTLAHNSRRTVEVFNIFFWSRSQSSARTNSPDCRLKNCLIRMSRWFAVCWRRRRPAVMKLNLLSSRSYDCQCSSTSTLIFEWSSLCERSSSSREGDQYGFVNNAHFQTYCQLLSRFQLRHIAAAIWSRSFNWREGWRTQLKVEWVKETFYRFSSFAGIHVPLPVWSIAASHTHINSHSTTDMPSNSFIIYFARQRRF